MKLSDNGENKKSSANAGNPACQGTMRARRLADLADAVHELRQLLTLVPKPPFWWAQNYGMFDSNNWALNDVVSHKEGRVSDIYTILMADYPTAMDGKPVGKQPMPRLIVKALNALPQLLDATEELYLSEKAGSSQGVRIEVESQSLPVGVQGQAERYKMMLDALLRLSSCEGFTAVGFLPPDQWGDELKARMEFASQIVLAASGNAAQGVPLTCMISTQPQESGFQEKKES